MTPDEQAAAFEMGRRYGELEKELHAERDRADGLNQSVLKWMARLWNTDKAWADERKAHDERCPDAIRADMLERSLRRAETVLARHSSEVASLNCDAWALVDDDILKETREALARYGRGL